MSKLQLPVIVTPSRVELGLRCYRRHVIGDLLQRIKYKSPSLAFGTVGHAGAGAWWVTQDSNKAQMAIVNEFHARFDGPSNDLTVELAQAMLRDYVAQATLAGPFTNEAGTWQLVSAEDRLEVPLRLPGGGEAKLSFQTDRVVWNQTTRHLVIVDTKTAGRLDKKWLRQWESSLQMKLYKAGNAKAYDFDVDQVDVVIEGWLKDVPSRVQYVVCPNWSQEILDEAVQQAVSIATRDDRIVGVYDQTNFAAIEEWAVNKTEINYMSCFEYGVECPYRQDICLNEPNQRVAALHAEFFEISEEDSAY